MDPIPLTSFYFLRHGETAWNLEHKTMGTQDIPLNDRGLYQAQTAAKRLAKEPLGTIVTSPLLRAKTTAHIVASHMKISSAHAGVTEIPDLQEACWGDQEGQPKGDETWFDDWLEGATIHNAETYVTFLDRVHQGLKKALACQGPVLIVSHGGVYRAICQCLDLPWVDLENAQTLFHQPPDHNHPSWRTWGL